MLKDTPSSSIETFRIRLNYKDFIRNLFILVFLSPRRSEGGSAPGSGADYPSGGGGAWI